MENKPSVLYRGIKIKYSDLKDFIFTGIDLKVNYEPIIDEYGRPTVTDGNEYGVYMTDNLNMVKSAYGNLHGDGIPVDSTLVINYQRILIPSVAIIYQINTDGLEIRKPFITNQLSGHYNNGFEGDEWIADVVPANNYTLYRVRIGEDILHDAEDIDLSSSEDIAGIVKQKLEMRKYRLETFVTAMKKISPKVLRTFNRDHINILKMIYGKNGLKYINEENLITNNVEGMIKYLIANTFKSDETNINFQTIRYLTKLGSSASSIDELIELLQSDKLTNEQKRKAFIERRESEGISYTTNLFDSREELLNDLISMVSERIKKDNKDIIDEDWETIKAKYNYNELSEERKRVIEQQFHDMLNQRVDDKKVESSDIISDEEKHRVI